MKEMHQPKKNTFLAQAACMVRAWSELGSRDFLLEQQRDTHHSGGADQLRQTYFNVYFRYFQIIFKGI